MSKTPKPSRRVAKEIEKNCASGVLKIPVREELDASAYGLVFRQTTKTVTIVWPSPSRKKSKQLKMKYGSPMFKVLLAALSVVETYNEHDLVNVDRKEFVSDMELARELFGEKAKSLHPTTLLKVKKAVSQFNDHCIAATRIASPPLCRQDGGYRLVTSLTSTD